MENPIIPTQKKAKKLHVTQINQRITLLIGAKFIHRNIRQDKRKKIDDDGIKKLINTARNEYLRVSSNILDQRSW
jgi:hypothetical protein